MKVVVALSGGVDSSVAAFLLKRRGFDVFGISFKLFEGHDISDAHKVCEIIGIPLEVLDLQQIFKREVIDYFAEEYLRGRTPNPCAICNLKIKFKFLMEKKKEINADYIATGHYVRVVKKDGKPFLKVAKDRWKSQEYFLSILPEEILKYTIFPLGEYTKEEVKKIAEKENLPVLSKHESQSVCFLGGKGRTYSDFLIKEYGAKAKRGKIIFKNGKELGEHEGYFRYTIGQRKGLRIPYGKPLYVIEIRPKENVVVVGEERDVYKREMNVDLIVWRGASSGEYRVRIRYQHTPAKALVYVKEKEAKVIFEEPQFAPTPGQLATFYEDDIVIGGGFIKSC